MRPEQLERVPVRAFWQWECPWCEGTVDTEWYGGMLPPVIVTCDDCGGRAVADGFLFGPGTIDHLDGPVPGPSREVADPGNGASPVVAGSRVEPATNATLADADDERLAIRDAWSELPLVDGLDVGDTDQD